MLRSKGIGWLGALAFVISSGGCKSANEVAVDRIAAKDPTVGAIIGVERKHAWIVQGVEGQSVTFNITVRNRQNKTNVPLDVDSVHIQGTDYYFPLQSYDEDSIRLFQSTSLTLSYEAIDLPLLDFETRKRLVSNRVQARYGGTDLYSAPVFIEVLRPYCEVDAVPFSTLGMTFETPAGVEPGGGWPTLLFIHGGGLNRRNHMDMEAYASFMLDQGYAVANMNHRLVDTKDNKNDTIYAKADSWKEPVADVKCAIRYLKENATVLKVDAGRIGLVGHSSGANIALEAATTVNSAMPEYAEQGTPIHLGVVSGNHDTSVAALFTMDAIVNFSVFWKIFDDSANALVAANAGLLHESQRNTLKNYIVSDFIREQTIINGFGPQVSGWESHPSAVAQDVVNFINDSTDLPIYMEHSSVNVVKEWGIIKLKTASYDSWKSGCTLYKAVEVNGSAKQQGQTFLKDNPGITHNDFVAAKSTVRAMSNDMLGFFNFYLKNQGTKPVTGFDYSRCDSLEAN